MTLEKVIYILGLPGRTGAVLSDTLPEREKEIGRILVLEQQINLVNIYPRIPPQLAVADYPVEDTVQHNQHTNRQQLLAQIPNVIANDP